MIDCRNVWPIFMGDTANATSVLTRAYQKPNIKVLIFKKYWYFSIY